MLIIAGGVILGLAGLRILGWLFGTPEGLALLGVVAKLTALAVAVGIALLVAYS